MRVRLLDKKKALGIAADSFEDEPGDVAALEKICFRDAWSSQDIRKMFADDYDRFFLLEDWLDNGVQSYGYALLRVLGGEAEILRICVLPSQRGRRYGRMLMEAVLAEAGEAPVFLEVRESNAAARSLYQSCGFEEIAVRKEYYTDPGEDAVIMRKG